MNVSQPWHERTECTPEEQMIKDWLRSKQIFLGRRILHVGVGNSSVAREFSRSPVDGIAFYTGEKAAADGLGLSNYGVYEVDKYSAQFRSLMVGKEYHYIIDTCTNSYAPSWQAFVDLIAFYRTLLVPEGMLLAGKHSLIYAINRCPAIPWIVLKYVVVSFTIEVHDRVLVFLPRQSEPTAAELLVSQMIGRIMSRRTVGLFLNSRPGQVFLKALFTDALARKTGLQAAMAGWKKERREDLKD